MTDVATPEAPTTPDAPAAPEVKPDATKDEKPLTAEDAAYWQKEAKEKGKAEAALRSRLRELEKADEARKQAEMSEAEKLTAELERIKAENSELLTFKQQTAIREAVTDRSRDANYGARRPEAIHKLVDHGALEFNEQGQVTEKSLDAELSRIKADFPELFYATGGGSANGGDGAMAQTGYDMNTIMRQRIGR